MAVCHGCASTAGFQAKLIHFSDLVREEPIAAGMTDSDSYLWAVAVRGQANGYNGGSGWPWTIWLVKDEPGTPQVWASIGGIGEYVATPIVIWPPFWDSLPDYSGGLR
jgi:hypothetical protein